MNKNEIQVTIMAGCGSEHAFDPVHQQPTARQVSQGDQENRHPLLGARFLALGDVLDRVDYIFQAPLGIKIEPGQAVGPSHDLIDTPQDAVWFVEGSSLPDKLLLEVLTHHHPISRTCHGFPTLERM